MYKGEEVRVIPKRKLERKREGAEELSALLFAYIS
jgi:hypothetical protein